MTEPSDLSRRHFLQTTVVGAAGLAAARSGAGFAATAAAVPDGGVGIDGLSVAGRFDQPLGVDDRSPLLAWRLAGRTQHAYRIRAASGTHRLASPDLWDSGWVESGDSTGAAYAGERLRSRQRVVWQVRVRDTEGRVSAWSGPSTWEVGLFDRSEWEPAVWIEHPARRNSDPLPVFARPFTIHGDKTVDRARLYVAGFGIYVATVNGQPVTDAVLSPGNSNPQQSTEAGVYDVATLLVPGGNTLGVQLGNGISNVVEVTNPGAGRTDTYEKFHSDVPEPATLAVAATAGDTRVVVDDADGFDVGATVNVDTGDGGANLESRIVIAVGTPGPNGTEIGLAEPLARRHPAMTTVTRSGTANETTTAISPRLLARLEIIYADGTADAIVTDPDWRTALGPTVTDNWYAGSDYDARREQAGWDRPGADLSESAARRNGTPTGWTPAGIASPPSLATRLTWRRGEPVTIVDAVAPVVITEPTSGTWVFDFGQNAAALPELRLARPVPAGTVITMQPAESLRADGTVDAGSMGSDDDIFDTYTAAGDPEGETWRARFSYHGFQYLQVTGLPSGYRATDDTMTALQIRAATSVSGDVSTSSDLVNRLHRMSRFSIASNMQSIFTDCPNREKLGWLADMLQSIHAIDRNFRMSAFLGQMQQAMAEAQLVDGPNAGLVPAHTPEFPVFDGEWAMYRDDVNWGSAVIVIPWWLWRRHGDTATMATHYQSMLDYHDYVRTAQAGADDSVHLVRGRLADWVAHDSSTPELLTGSYGYYLMTDKLAQMAAGLGKRTDMRRYRTLAGEIKAEFNDRFFNDTLRAYTNDGNAGTTGTQAADALALDAGLVPDGEAEHVLDSLVQRIDAYHPDGEGPHLSGGTISLGPIFRALSNGGRDDVIWKLLHETSRPGYGAFLQPSVMNPGGMTTVPEHWYAPDRNSSLNHMILLQVDEWFSMGLAGIQHAPGDFAYGRTVVKPKLVGTHEHPLRRVAGYYDSARGRISSRWEISGRHGRDLTFVVQIPGNSAAEIHVPTISPGTVRVNGRPAKASREVEFQSYTDGYAVFSAGPGRYRFSARLGRGGSR